MIESCEKNGKTASFDNLGLRNGEARRLGKSGDDQFFGEDTKVLRIVLELHDPEVAIGTEHELTLGTAAHSSDCLDGLDGQRRTFQVEGEWDGLDRRVRQRQRKKQIPSGDDKQKGVDDKQNGMTKQNGMQRTTPYGD